MRNYGLFTKTVYKGEDTKVRNKTYQLDVFKSVDAKNRVIKEVEGPGTTVLTGITNYPEVWEVDPPPGGRPSEDLVPVCVHRTGWRCKDPLDPEG